MASEDARFLLVHHTASSNDYPEADVPELLRDAASWPLFAAH